MPYLLLTIIVFVLLLTMIEALLLSDLPSPSFLFDVSAIRRFAFQPAIGTSTEQKVPSLILPHQGITIYPCSDDGRIIYDAPPCETLFSDNDYDTTPETSEVFCFLHASVIRPRDGRKDGEDPNTFIAELDLPPSLCRNGLTTPTNRDPARLCLGLNNHHVGGYYWARSSGSGSTMEAPGVRYVDGGNNSGILQWNNSGPHASNSNDGKRSEWVNFLRKGDKVQLIPISAEESLVEFIKYFDNMGQNECIRVYGITTDGRPLGSDPSVVCEFRCDM